MKNLNLKFDAKSNKPLHQIRNDLILFFEKINFEVVLSKGGTLKFKKGSLTKNLFTFNALNVKSETNITLSPNGLVTGQIIVDLTGQMVTEHEVNLWKIFIKNIEEFIEKGIENRNKERRNKLLSIFKSLILVVVLPVIFFIIVLILLVIIVSFFE